MQKISCFKDYFMFVNVVDILRSLLFLTPIIVMHHCYDLYDNLVNQCGFLVSQSSLLIKLHETKDLPYKLF